MRIFLVVVSFINIFLYYLIYALFDKFIELLGWTELSPGFLNFIKLLMLVVVGFLIGLLVIILLDIGPNKRTYFEKSYFDVKSSVILGFIPAIGLLLSGGTITNFFITRFFGSNKDLSEICYYLFSNSSLWSIWLGFSIGASVRLRFKKKIGYQKIYDFGNSGNDLRNGYKDVK